MRSLHKVFQLRPVNSIAKAQMLLFVTLRFFGEKNGNKMQITLP